jgi:predicted nuclease with TOPRIM domain
MDNDLKNENEKLKIKIKKLEEEKEKLIDEVESLWMMMDEITSTDIKSWSHLMGSLETDVLTRALIITKKKADA